MKTRLRRLLTFLSLALSVSALCASCSNCVVIDGSKSNEITIADPESNYWIYFRGGHHEGTNYGAAYGTYQIGVKTH